MPEAREPVQINIRLWPGHDDDLIRWYRGLNAPHGRLSQIIRETLRRGIRGADEIEALRREVAELRAMVQVVVGQRGESK